MQIRPTRVQGTVRTTDGTSLSMGANVRLELDNATVVAERPADSDGGFYFDGLTGRRYRLVVTAAGFETHSELIEFSEGIHLAVCDVTLKRSPQDSDSRAPEEPRSDALVPKSARKEFEQASKALESNDLEKAQTHLERAVKEYPCYAQAQAHLATVFKVRQNAAGAEGALRKAIECDPDYLSSYILLGELLNDQKRHAESLEVLKEGERRAPSSWQICYQLGVAYFGLGQYGQAESEYQKVKDFNPTPPPELPLRLADIHLKEKDYDKAYVEMRQYLDAEPNGRFAPKVRGIVQQIDASGILKQQQAGGQ